MIGLPFNDHKCLASITEVVAGLVELADPVLVELAAKHGTTDNLITYIRGIPQRDDDGEKGDGPRLDTCEPPQRLRIPGEDPNCVERAALSAVGGQRAACEAQLPADQATALLRSAVGIYSDLKQDRRVIDNVRLLGEAIWKIAPDGARHQVGLKFSSLAVNGHRDRP